MRLKFKIKEKWDLNSKVLFKIHISLDKWNLWYTEVMRRIKAWESEVFDIDECLELWQMSHKHFEEMDKFLFE